MIDFERKGLFLGVYMPASSSSCVGRQNGQPYIGSELGERVSERKRAGAIDTVVVVAMYCRVLLYTPGSISGYPPPLPSSPPLPRERESPLNFVP